MIYKFPAGLDACTQLHRIDLSHNKLTEIPYEVVKLERLQTLDVSYNIMIFPPPEICSASLDVLIAYIKNEQLKVSLIINHSINYAASENH